MEAVLLEKFDTKYSADSVEFCPIENFEEFFCVGTYLVEANSFEEGSGGGEGYSRKGKLVLIREMDVYVDADCSAHNCDENGQSKAFSVVQEVEGSAILDLKWTSNLSSTSGPTLASVTSTGHTIIYSLLSDHDDDNVTVNPMLSEIARHSNSTECLVLSLDWSLNSRQIASSQSNGCIQILNVGQEGCSTAHEWKAHDFEAWITCFDPTSPSVLYSGGDDCKFKAWDERMGFSLPSMVNKHTHTAGVTAISRDQYREYSIATGSYDEYVRLWDTRMLQTPISSLQTGGGIWRIKFHPTDSTYIAVASMYNGFHILNRAVPSTCSGTTLSEDCFCAASKMDLAQLSISCKLKEPHSSIAYGIDWSRKSGRLGTCSFYDNLFCMWSMSDGQ